MNGDSSKKLKIDGEEKTNYLQRLAAKERNRTDTKISNGSEKV